jgi:hypothetical protein
LRCGAGLRPVWAPPGTHRDVELIGEVAVWRAANGIAPHDRRPTGPAQLQTLPALWQRDLDRRIQHSDKTFDNSVVTALALGSAPAVAQRQPFTKNG